MKIGAKRALGLLLAATLLLACLAGCVTVPSSNESAVFKMEASWQINFTNNYYCGVSVEPISGFVVEGLYNRLDTVDYIVPILADGMPVHNEDGTTTVKIKANANWHNGDPVTAQDIIAFYMIHHTTVTYYMKNIEAIDDKTIKITWNSNKPISNEIRDKLFALDYNCTIKYDEYKYWVDKNAELLWARPDAAADNMGSTPFGKDIDADTSAKMLANYTEFSNHSPSWYVATGPFKIKTYTATQFILEKNPDYWAADQIAFDTIECYSYSDTNLIYNSLRNGELYYFDGMLEEFTMNSLVNSETNLVNIKMLDATSVGINFNMESPIWQDIRVREAFQYIFDREEIRNISNPYAPVDYTACNTMPMSEEKKHLSKEHHDMIKQYSYDHDKAAALLESAGWSKKDGYWHDASGERVQIAMGGCNNLAIWSSAAEAALAQLLEFGFDCQLKLTDMGTLFGVGMGDDSPYDCVVMWTEFNGSISNPYGNFKGYSDYYGYFTHVPRFSAGDMVGEGKALAGDINMEFAWVDGSTGVNGRQTVNFSEYLHSLYYLPKEDAELITASIVVGMSEYMYGVNFYQNVTASTLNVAMVDGVPFEDQWSVTPNLEYVPDITTEDGVKAAQMNFVWSDATAFILGIVKPNIADTQN